MEMHGRQSGADYEVRPVVSDTCYAHVTGYAPAVSLERIDRAVCDDVRRTYDAVQIRTRLQKFLHTQISALRIEIRDPDQTLVHRHSGTLKRLCKAFPSGKARCQVIFADTDISDPLSALRNHSLREFPHAASVVVIDAGKAVVFLPGDYKRDRAVL